MRWPIFCLTRSKSFAAPLMTKSMRESLVALWNLLRRFLVLAIALANRRPLAA